MLLVNIFIHIHEKFLTNGIQLLHLKKESSPTASLSCPDAALMASNAQLCPFWVDRSFEFLKKKIKNKNSESQFTKKS
jgi:hypothetical protein